jgi:phosphate-selective porin OprO/OprP
VSHSASISVRIAIAAWLCLVAAVCLSQEAEVASQDRESTTIPPPGATTFRLRGRIDTDVIGTVQNAANQATFGNLGNVAGVRRAWIGAQGDLAIGRYITEFDLASGNVVVRDVFLGLGDWPDGGEVRVGHYLEPFSLELGTLSYVFPFMECSAISALDPARNWGLGLFRAGLSDTTRLGLGVFQAGTDPNDIQGGAGSTVGFTGKLTTAPINDGDGEQLLHFGLAMSERLPEHGVILVGQQPQSSLLGLADVASSPFTPGIRIPASFQQLVNLQCAAANGSLWAQAEWTGSWVAQRGGGPVFFHGCHVDCGYFLTGEHRQYQVASGTFGPIKVNQPWIRTRANQDRPIGWGAWELTSRFAYLDFRDPDEPTGPVGQLVGIRLPEATLGVNWYLADHLRLMFNYSCAVPDEPNTGSSVAHIFGGRLAVFW